VILFAVGLSVLAAWLLIPRSSSARLKNINAVKRTELTLQQRILLVKERFMRDSGAVDEKRNHTITAITGLAADLRAGISPAMAVAHCGGEPSVWPHARAAALRHSDSSDVIEGLELDARDNPELKYLTACWRVGVNSGTGLASSITLLAQSLRSAQEIRIQLQAELAGPRATARMLAFLPLIGIGLGYLLGAEPLTWLLSSPLGWLTLISGVTLTGLGVWWSSNIAARVEQML